MRIVFFGTPDYVLPILETVHRKFSRHGVSPIAAVVTQPPRPSGRKQLKQFSAVDSWAFKKKLPIYHSAQEYLNSGTPADVGVLAAYGEIIPEFVINNFEFGILNVHPSLLPKWRGASPIQAALISGEKVTGATIIKLDQKVDHGPILSQFKEDVLDNDTTGILRERLFARSAEVLAQLLESYLKKKITPSEQAHAEATFTSQIKKGDAFIPPEYLDAAIRAQSLEVSWEIGFIKDLSLIPSPLSLDRFVRAMDPWPVSWTKIMLNGQRSMVKRLKIMKAHLEDLSINHQSLAIDLVQLEGKGPVSWKQFKEAYPSATFAEE